MDDAGLLDGVRVPILDSDAGKRSCWKRISYRTRREKQEVRVLNEGSRRFERIEQELDLRSKLGSDTKLT